MQTLNMVAAGCNTECRPHPHLLVFPARRLEPDVTIRALQAETLEKTIQLILGDFSFTQQGKGIVSKAHDFTGEVVWCRAKSKTRRHFPEI
jgi:hypothetical protein